MQVVHVLVAAHVGTSLNDGGADEIAIGVARNSDVTTVEQNLASVVLCGGNETSHPSLGRWGDERTPG